MNLQGADPRRRRIVAGNWKMHFLAAEAAGFCRELLRGLAPGAPGAPSDPAAETEAGSGSGLPRPPFGRGAKSSRPPQPRPLAQRAAVGT